MDRAGCQLLDALFGYAPQTRAADRRLRLYPVISERVQDLVDLSALAPQSLDHWADAVDDLLLQLLSIQYRAFGGVLDDPTFSLKLVAEPVSKGEVPPLPRLLPLGHLEQDVLVGH